jgi:DNA-binding NarL/FixJ family response regulator
MDGIKAIQQIRTSVPSVEVIALTMNGYKAYHDEVISVGASACISVWDMRTELLPILKTLLAPRNENTTK